MIHLIGCIVLIAWIVEIFENLNKPCDKEDKE